MEKRDGSLHSDPLEQNPSRGQHLQLVHTVETQLEPRSLRQDIWREFFGTKLDKQKSVFVISMLSLIVSFFVISAFSMPLDLIVGMIIICLALYGALRLARHLWSGEI